MTRSGIIAGGNFIVDRIKMLDVWPSQDALAHIHAESKGNGGGPYNVLKDLRKLGASFPLEAMGLIGEDEAGRWIQQDLENHEIRINTLRTTSESPTSYTDVMTVESSGRRTFFHQSGTNALWNPTHVDFSQLSSYRHFHYAYLMLLESMEKQDHSGNPAVTQVLQSAQQHGLSTSVDCVSSSAGGFPDLVQAVLPFTNYLFMNEWEASRITGLEIGEGDTLDMDQVQAAAAQICHHTETLRVFIHFPQGVYSTNGRGEDVVQGSVRLPMDRIRGATGAGDAFCAGTLFGIHEDLPIPKCMELGVCAAAACLQFPTASDGVLPVDQSLALGQEFGFYSLT